MVHWFDLMKGVLRYDLMEKKHTFTIHKSIYSTLSSKFVVRNWILFRSVEIVPKKRNFEFSFSSILYLHKFPSNKNFPDLHTTLKKSYLNKLIICVKICNLIADFTFMANKGVVFFTQ